MTRTEYRDLDAWRYDAEVRAVGFTTIGFVGAASFLYVALDAYRVTGRLTFGKDLLAPALVLLAGALWGAVRIVRGRSRSRTLVLDTDARTFEVRDGSPRRRTLRSGGYADFASVRLDTKVRKVFTNRGWMAVEFWAVSVDWKDTTRRPFCLEEFAGQNVTPPPWGPRPYKGGEHRRAQAALARWADAFGVPAQDKTVRTL